MLLKLHSVPVPVKLASAKKCSRRYGNEKKLWTWDRSGIEFCLCSLFFGLREVPSRLWGCFLICELTSYSCVYLVPSLMISTMYTAEKNCFPTGVGQRKDSHKILLPPFLCLEGRKVYCYCLLLLFSDILRFWYFEISGFFSPGEVKTVRTLPVWFAFIPISELLRQRFSTLSAH